MDDRTRVLTVSSVEFASGFRNDLDALGELCRERGVFFFVDAIQSLGVFPLDVQQTPIDALSADGHKWLLGPEGAGIGYVRREWVERLHPIGVGANSVVHPLRLHDDRLHAEAARGPLGGRRLQRAGHHRARREPRTAAERGHRERRAPRDRADRLPLRPGSVARLERVQQPRTGREVGDRVARSPDAAGGRGA